MPTNKQRSIVAVHGLGGHAYKTWTAESGHMWLKDSLPAHFPRARIMTFSYDSPAAWLEPDSGIQSAALDLLTQLRAARRTTVARARRIIFICHSLGGIVVKKALLCAQILDQYERMLRHITGVLFMSTPNRESPTLPWLRLLKGLINCGRLEPSVRVKCTEKVDVAARVVANITQSCSQCLGPPMKVISVYEQEELQPFERQVSRPADFQADLCQYHLTPLRWSNRTVRR